MAQHNSPTPASLEARDDAPLDRANLPHDNYGPSVNVIIWVLTGAAGLFLALRMFCKYIRGKKMWWDDYVLIASFVRSPSSLIFWNLPFINQYWLLGVPDRPDFPAFGFGSSRVRHALVGYYRLVSLPPNSQHNRRLFYYCGRLEQNIFRNLAASLHRRLEAPSCLVRYRYRQHLFGSQRAPQLGAMHAH